MALSPTVIVPGGKQEKHITSDTDDELSQDGIQLRDTMKTPWREGGRDDDKKIDLSVNIAIAASNTIHQHKSSDTNRTKKRRCVA